VDNSRTVACSPAKTHAGIVWCEAVLNPAPLPLQSWAGPSLSPFLKDAAHGLESGGQLLLEAVAGGPVVPAALEPFGQVLLANNSVREVVRIQVALAMPHALGTRVVGVTEVERDMSALARAHINGA